MICRDERQRNGEFESQAAVGYCSEIQPRLTRTIAKRKEKRYVSDGISTPLGVYAAVRHAARFLVHRLIWALLLDKNSVDCWATFQHAIYNDLSYKRRGFCINTHECEGRIEVYKAHKAIECVASSNLISEQLAIDGRH